MTNFTRLLLRFRDLLYIHVYNSRYICVENQYNSAATYIYVINNLFFAMVP